MKLKMLAGMSGPKVNLSPGDITEQFGTVEAMRLVSAGIAERMEDAIEVADAVPAPETRKGRKGRR